MTKPHSTIDRPVTPQAIALLIDSDPSSRDSLCKLLAESNIRTLLATNSVQALAVLRSEAIHVVICEDLGGLYAMELFEACQALFPNVRRVYLAKKAPVELQCETMVRGHVHATISHAMHPVDLRNAIAALLRT